MKIKANNSSFPYNIDNFAIDLNNEKNKNLLNSYGFHSLTRLLSSPSKVHTNLNSFDKKEINSYNAIVDAKGLKELEELLESSEFCAIDTEADDKDPHNAIIFGVSFSMKKGEAFFVPLIEDDLKDIKQKDVISFLKRISQKPIKFIGHNFKYDYLLLRKNGIKIQNIYFDTMLAAYECFGDWTFFNLKYLSYKFLGKEIKSYKEIVDKGKTFFDLPFNKIVNHACEDADITLQIYYSLHEELEKREIIDQYSSDTLPLVKKLGDMEFNGVSVNFDKLSVFRKRILNRSLELKKNIFKKIGKEFDIDSHSDLSAIINDTMNLREFVRSRKITLSVLEQLAVNNPIAKLIVKYKRLQKRMKKVDAIVKSAKGKKIYPIFNQIKASYGQISSTGPNLFEVTGSDDIKNFISKSLRPYFRDTKSSMDILEKLSHDQNFKKDRVKNKNEFMEAHPQMKEFEKDEFLLTTLIGYSDAKLSQKFMIDRLTLSTLRHELEMRYPTLFQWIEDFKTHSAKQGYAKLGNKRRYLDGLKSSNLEKRKKAINLSVRWLIQY
jgi:DNA polymerase-1